MLCLSSKGETYCCLHDFVRCVIRSDLVNDKLASSIGKAVRSKINHYYVFHISDVTEVADEEDEEEEDEG